MSIWGGLSTPLVLSSMGAVHRKSVSPYLQIQTQEGSRLWVGTLLGVVRERVPHSGGYRSSVKDGREVVGIGDFLGARDLEGSL